MKIKSISWLTVLLFVFMSVRSDGQPTPSASIRLNQIGFYPNESKIAVIMGGGNTDFYIATADQGQKVFAGKLSEPVQSLFSTRKTQTADFTALSSEGKYILVVPGIGHSYPFQIKQNVFDALTKASLKAFYFQRFSTALPEKYGGRWARPLSHPDDQVLIHASASDVKRPEGTLISTPRGWMDAGDYNKYIVNSGIATATLLSAYEDYPGYYQNQKIDIPENSNRIPDILDEVLWNLRWMLTMQDPNDGGVYHKCTNASFDPMVMPHMATAPRFVVQKTTGAALNLAAVAAQAARIFRTFEKELPGMADSCINASTRAWKWALENRDVRYDQNKMNDQFDPDITTGAYGDNDLKDEFYWAACELAAATSDDTYLSAFRPLAGAPFKVPSWNQVRLLGHYTLMKNRQNLPSLAGEIRAITEGMVKMAYEMVSGIDKRDFRTVMGASSKDFVWGSNAVAANQAVVLLHALRLSGDRTFFTQALSNFDYLLGRNATGYSYVTGFGAKTPMHPHHRPSEADGIDEPIPGLLAGGPNPGMQDKCSYHSTVPDEAYVDDVCSYASNEIAINWNAPFVYLAGALEALQGKR